jgi:hypothetical protein
MMVRKKQGRSYTLYLPENLVAHARVVADARDRSMSFVIACALREYLAKPAKDDAPAARTAEASGVQPHPVKGKETQ